ncbi:MAG: FAD-dependent oxidoreductase [Vicinamibacteria bacterium]|nr:FAD-dependent oxidoreductase [Vicinamibacteria bacterium]
MRVLIIGGSAAGAKAASKVRRLDEHAEITIIQKGRYLSMASCGYPYYIGGVFDDRNMLISTPAGDQRDSSFFSNVKNIKALVGTEAVRIDRAEKTVTARHRESGRESILMYDKLVLATGADPIFPELPGKKLEGVATLQSMEDAEYLKKVVVERQADNAVIIGGGLIGIETCEALGLGGVKITIVEKEDQILPFLDWEMAKLAENHLAGKGVKILTNAAAAEIVGDGGKVAGVRTAAGETIPCELVVVSIGVRPNGRLAKEAGLRVGARGGILVNRFMQTEDSDIYAAGDCVEVTNLVTHARQPWPMGDAANLQGRVVAQNVVFGNIEEYEGFVGTGICKVFGCTVGGTGLSEKMARAEGYSNIITSTHAAPDKPGFMGAQPLVIKMIADRTTGRFLGMQAVGLGDVAKRLAMAAMALHGRLSIADMVNLDLPYAPPFSPAIDNFVQAVHVIENKWRGMMDGVSCVEVKQKLDDKADVFLLDVRGPEEYAKERLGAGEVLIPLGQLRSKTDLLPKDKAKEIIAFCKISLRGYEAACFLRSMGYTNVRVMEGGLMAWPYPRLK